MAGTKPIDSRRTSAVIARDRVHVLAIKSGGMETRLPAFTAHRRYIRKHLPSSSHLRLFYPRVVPVELLLWPCHFTHTTIVAIYRKLGTPVGSIAECPTSISPSVQWKNVRPKRALRLCLQQYSSICRLPSWDVRISKRAQRFARNGPAIAKVQG